MDIENTGDAIRRRAKEFDLEFLKHIHATMPRTLDTEDMDLLVKAGYIEPQKDFVKEEQEADALPELDRTVLSIDSYLSKCEAKYEAQWKKEKILRRHWMPESPDVIDDPFWKFINSSRRRLCELEPYEPFYLYITQERRWAAERKRYDKIKDQYERDVFAANERARISANTLYFANKYAKIKEPDEPYYVANLAHALLLFLFDTERLVYLGKPRQMAFTTTMGVCACKELLCHQSSTQVIIAHDKESGQTILEDKIKFVYGHLEDWMKLEPLNDPDGAFRLSHDPDAAKGTKKAKSSSITARTPAITAINSRSPKRIWIDEAPFIPIFDKMMREGRTTLFGMDMRVGRMRWKRSLWAGGTGGATDIGKGIFEREFKGLISKWQRKDFSEGIVPIFLDWTARPGITPEFYLSERSAYAAGSKDGQTHLSMQERMIQFRNHFPSSVDDMFNASKATLVPWSMIVAQIERIGKWQSKGTHVQYGRFEPVYNMGEPMPKGSVHPYKIIGATWIPSSDNDLMAPVIMWSHPDKGWRYRYYQGTDPIQHDMGRSKMASAVMDAHHDTIACIVNFRTEDPNESYLQTALMGMYYADQGSKFCPELVESNLMAGYVSYKCGPWLDGERSLVRKMELPDFLRVKDQSGTVNSIGVDNKAQRKATIIGMLKDFLLDSHKRIFIPDLWEQLRHFVATPTRGIVGTIWGSEDADKYNDDVIMATAFAYICRLSYNNRSPIKNDELERIMNAPRKKLRRNPVTNEVYYVTQ